ncbi:HAMP domain-containing sensor histidine kinase [Bowmanella dokdonensis]|uniref:histidine kinase n=1 Tax=Bowmanella dokdonensis TaxID=751969 RepID=A0A939DNQ1_9ALTE|nr:HAMP domain-containing sensor histidine kinase [Bowmanella dokdonensis]MBN7825939.1 HAMP domain-containing histidine kinase [Bowmanella dokdonensis]
MALSLYQRLALSLVLVFLLMLWVFYWWSAQLQSRTRHEAEQRLHLSLAEHLVQDNPLLVEGVYDYQALENLFHTLMLLGPSFEFYYLDPSGRILAYSAEPEKIKRQRVDLEPIRQLLRYPQSLPVLGEDPRSLTTRKIFSAAPVRRDGALQGYLYMIIGGEAYDSVLAQVRDSHGLQKPALLGAFTLVFLLVLLLLLFGFFTRPLKRLTETMQAYSRQDFKLARMPMEKWHPDSGNEVHRLGDTFNRMMAHIHCQFETLQWVDNQRRALLTDLSHDLRTPLANLQGYIETLALNEDSLTEHERRRFVDICLKNARNLKHLIDQIFELAYLEGGQVTLNQESFALGDLLYDVVAKFALQADQKRIRLRIIPDEFQYQVFADIAKLERVLTNLLDNALRHTPKGGAIDIEVGLHQDRIRVNIRDNGVGISQKELAYIFDARYRARNSQEDKALHTGLGLAISKKLIALLDSDLQVESELGKGTCFSFELKQMP